MAVEPNREILLRIERAQRRQAETLARIENGFAHLFVGQIIMAQELDDLEQAVTRQETVVESVLALISGLKKKLDEAIASGDMGRVRTAVQRLDAAKTKLAEAVAANTAAEDEVPAPGGGEPPADTQPSA